MTSDQNILDIVKHCHISFYDDIEPVRTELKRPMIFSKQENVILDKEIENLLQMEVIEEVEFSSDQFLSPIFTVPKKDGEYRMILNLKDLNFNIIYHHFKMDTFEIALGLIKPNCFMASIDVRHAYYSVPIAPEHRKFLRFCWKNKFYQYTCLPNGISSAPRYFTKLLKPVYCTLRKMGHSNLGYIDDSLLIGDTKQECHENVQDTKELFEKVGFIVHQKKSVFIPVQKLRFLGFLIDSVNMIVTLPDEKVENVIIECKKVYNKKYVSLRDLAKIIGILVLVFPAVEQGPLHYRTLELQKIKGLKTHKGDFNAKVQITDIMKFDLKWWINNVKTQYRTIDYGDPKLIITTDASLAGWGAVCEGVKIGGRWSETETQYHINVLELLAVFYALKSFCKNKSNMHIGLRIDNTCAIAHIQNKGGIRSKESNDLAVKIWSWCIDRKIWISANYVPSSENIADLESRRFNENIEWMLNIDIFNKLTESWGVPDIDLFATRLNAQVEKYASWKPDPGCEFIDAFSVPWSNSFFYVFPPFSLLGKVIQKLRRDRTEHCMVIAPIWPTQCWYTNLLQLLIDKPIILPTTDNLLTIKYTEKKHPLHRKLTLMACLVSGNVRKVETFLKA